MDFASLKNHILLRQSILKRQGNHYDWVAKDPVVRYTSPGLHFLANHGLLEVDEASLRTSKAAYYQNKARWVLWEPVSHQVIQLFHDHDIETIPLKAFDYTHQLYPDPGLRAFSDIDLLVKKGKFIPAIQTLMQHNFRLVDEDLRVLMQSPEKVTEVTLLSPQGFAIEIHQSLLPVKNFFRYEKAFNLDESSLWNRAEKRENTSGLHASLNLVDKLAHMCLHAATHGLSAQSPFTYLDLDSWVRKESSNINWQEFIQVAQSWKIRSAAYHTFQLCKHIYDTPIPNEVLMKVDPGFWAKWRVNWVYSIESYISNNHKKPGIRTPKWVRLMLHDQFTDIPKILLGGLFPTSQFRQTVYGTPASLLSHWSRLLKKIKIPNP
jgi:hypothetical protein